MENGQVFVIISHFHRVRQTYQVRVLLNIYRVKLQGNVGFFTQKSNFSKFHLYKKFTLKIKVNSCTCLYPIVNYTVKLFYVVKSITTKSIVIYRVPQQIVL
jgi:hypothetical protein